jgi:hypothetical protein
MSSLDSLLEGPPRHLERFAPPWSTTRLTICGRPLDDVAAWVSFDEGRKLVVKIGQTRAALIFCQTCVNRQHMVDRPEAWEKNPARIVHDYTRHTWREDAAAEHIRAELLSLAKLADAHRDEYDAMVAAYLNDEITARRKAKTS